MWSCVVRIQRLPAICCQLIGPPGETAHTASSNTWIYNLNFHYSALCRPLLDVDFSNIKESVILCRSHPTTPSNLSSAHGPPGGGVPHCVVHYVVITPEPLFLSGCRLWSAYYHFSVLILRANSSCYVCYTCTSTDFNISDSISQKNFEQLHSIAR